MLILRFVVPTFFGGINATMAVMMCVVRHGFIRFRGLGRETFFKMSGSVTAVLLLVLVLVAGYQLTRLYLVLVCQD